MPSVRHTSSHCLEIWISIDPRQNLARALCKDEYYSDPQDRKAPAFYKYEQQSIRKQIYLGLCANRNIKAIHQMFKVALAENMNVNPSVSKATSGCPEKKILMRSPDNTIWQCAQIWISIDRQLNIALAFSKDGYQFHLRDVFSTTCTYTIHTLLVTVVGFDILARNYFNIK